MPDTERTRLTPGTPFIRVLIRKVTILLDFRWAQALGLGNDGDVGLVEIREDIHG